MSGRDDTNGGGKGEADNSSEEGFDGILPVVTLVGGKLCDIARSKQLE